jgi:hypothetical protein
VDHLAKGIREKPALKNNSPWMTGQIITLHQISTIYDALNFMNSDSSLRQSSEPLPFPELLLFEWKCQKPHNMS